MAYFPDVFSTSLPILGVISLKDEKYANTNAASEFSYKRQPILCRATVYGTLLKEPTGATLNLPSQPATKWIILMQEPSESFLNSLAQGAFEASYKQ